MNERHGYGDAEAKRIIERAAEIEAEQGQRLDAPALREIAAEAGISSHAVDRALQEHDDRALQENDSKAQAPVSWVQRNRTKLIVTGVGAILFIALLMGRTV